MALRFGACSSSSASTLSVRRVRMPSASRVRAIRSSCVGGRRSDQTSTSCSASRRSRAWPGSRRVTKQRAMSVRSHRRPRTMAGEVWLALLLERVDALLCLLGIQEETETAERELADADDVLGVGVEGLLEETERGGGEGEHVVGPGSDLLPELVAGNDLIDQAPAFGGRGVVLAAAEPDLAGALLADDAGEVGAAKARVEGADPRPDLPKPRMLYRHRHVTDHVQHVAAANGQAVDRGDHRLGHLADQPVQALDLEQA